MMGSKQRRKKAISRGSTAGGAEWSTPGKRKNTHDLGTMTAAENCTTSVRNGSTAAHHSRTRRTIAAHTFVALFGEHAASVTP
jgi:hypothetical protein